VRAPGIVEQYRDGRTSLATLFIVRHAETGPTRPASTDHERELTPAGQQQARRLGEYLRGNGFEVDVVFCSSARRAQQTLAGMELGEKTEVEVVPALYNAGGESVLGRLRGLDDAVHAAMIVGHAPGLPWLAVDLADPATSDPQALRIIETRFPAGTLTAFEFESPWSALTTATLTAAYLP